MLVFIALPAYTQIIYVSQNSTGTGASWTSATGNLKAALDNAPSGTQIWVKEGIYYPTTCTNCDFSKRNTWFSIPNGVKLYGGFAGNETAIAQRNIAVHPTYLSGDIDQDGTLSNNSFTIIYTHDVSNQTEVDGFIITGGNASDNTFPTGAPQNSGAGWFNNGATNGFSSHPVVRNCRFENNFAWGFAGAMMNDGGFGGSSSTVYTNCVFEENISRLGGGAFYNSGTFNGHCSPSFTDCIFKNNECEENDGGAFFNIGSEHGVCNVSFTRCEFTGNNAGHDGGAIYNFGNNGNSSPTIIDCLFQNNSGAQGGAIYNDGTFGGFNGAEIINSYFLNNMSTAGDAGAIYNSGFAGTCNPIIRYCNFEGNTSTLAGGVIFNNGTQGVCNPIIMNCKFIDNEAITFGGSIYNQGHEGNSSPEITNCIFAENKALSAGAIYNLGADQGNANAVITNCTFYKNNANVGGAVYANAGEDTSGVSSPTIANCIFWENTANDIGDIFRIINGTPTISFSLVDKVDCNDLYHGNGGVLNCNDGMIFNQNPKFIDALSRNFHLQANSPAIDFGDNGAIGNLGINTDLDDLPRIYNGTVDFGVYEYGSTMGGSPVIIQQPNNQEGCEGSSASFSVSATGSGSLTYQWFKNGIAINGADENVLTIAATTINDEGSYNCEVTNGNETITSESALLEVSPLLAVELTVTASQETICEGEEITLTAHPVNGGSSPAFQWLINGNPFGGSIGSFNINALNDGDTFSCQVVSSESCVINSTAISNVVTIHVESTVTAALSIAPEEEEPCEGEIITFTAAAENGGSSPSYEWLVNGTTSGDDSPTFEFIPLQGDEVQCRMTSSKTCVEVPTVASNIFIINTIPSVTASIQITPSIDTVICIDQEVVFSTEIINGGDMPTYEWEVNNISVGGTDPTFSTTDLNNGDMVNCLLTSSMGCLETNPVSSNGITVEVDSCTVGAFEQMQTMPTVHIYPNPSDGRIFVEMLGISSNFTIQIINTYGQVLLSDYEKHPIEDPVKQELNLTHLPTGVYYFQIITDGAITTKRITVN